MRGSLWYQCSRKLSCLDEAEEVVPSYQNKDTFCKVPSDLAPFLQNMESLEGRCDTFLSGQLDGVALQKGEKVLVKNPEVETDDPEKCLTEQTISDIKNCLLWFEQIGSVDLENIFREDYRDKPPNWSKNLLDEAFRRDKESFQKDELVSFLDSRGQCHIGRLKWIGKVPWRDDHLFGIECLKESPSAQDDRFLKSVRVVDVEEGKAFIATEESKVDKIESFLLRTSNKEIDGRKNMRGLLCCKKSRQLRCLDELEEAVSLARPDHNFCEVPLDLAPFLLPMTPFEDRCDAFLSDQFKKVVLQKGESVLVKKDGATTGDPEKDLTEQTISDIKGLRIFVEQNHEVSIKNIFRKDYVIHPPRWEHNLLQAKAPGKDDSGKKSFNKDDFVSFFDSKGQCHIGRLKWMGSVPWIEEDHLFGIECLTKSPSSAQDDRFLKFVKVMDAEEGKAFIAERKTCNVEKMAAAFMLKNEMPNGAKRGTFCCKLADRMFCLDDDVKFESKEENSCAEVPLEHLIVLQRCVDLQERTRAVLTGQLQGLRFTAGEEVFVTQSPESTGNPFDDLQRRNLTAGKDEVVEEVGDFSVGRIYSPSYLHSHPEWAKNKLDEEGFQMLAHDQEIQIDIPGQTGQLEGKVKWMGQLPWLDELMVGMVMTEPLPEKSEDHRYLEYVQILQCDAKKAVMIPYNEIPNEHKGTGKASLFNVEDLLDLQIDSQAAFIDKTDNSLKVGTVKWTGRHRVMFDGAMAAVIVLKKRHKSGTNGVFLGESLVRCRPGCALMIGIDKLFKVEQLKVGDHVTLILEPKRCGIVRWIETGETSEQRVGIELTKRVRDYDDVSQFFECPVGSGILKSNTELKKITSAEYEASLSEIAPYPPVSKDELRMLCGQPRGIQGDCNSCYLDTTIFSMFAFSSYFERKISREATPNDHKLFQETKEALLNGIVYPLRRNKYVPFIRIKRLRKLLSKASGKKEFLKETRDIPECMDTLFGTLLSMETLLDLGNGAHYNGVYTVQTLPVFAELPVLTSQLVMEYSSMVMDFHIKEFPRVLMLQLPREKASNMSLIPSITLDLNFVVKESGEKKCSLCKGTASQMCSSLFDKNGLASTFLCDFCAQDHPDSRPLPDFLMSAPGKRSDITLMHLSSVICIELSHYNCFARCGDHKDGKWVFFDSMADQEQIDGVNRCLPRITKVDVTSWIKKASKQTNFNFKSYTGPDEEIYQRLFKYPYCLIYEREDL